MKKLIFLLLVLSCVLSFAACGGEEPETAGSEVPSVIHEGRLYSSTGRQIPAEVDESAIAGHIRSVVPPSQLPCSEGEANFGQIGDPYALTADGLLVLMDHEWTLFAPPAGTEAVLPTLDRKGLEEACADSFIGPSRVTVLSGEWAYTADPNKYVALATVRYTDKDDEYETADFVMVGTFGGKTELFHNLNEHSPYTAENALEAFGAVDGQRFPLK